MTAYLAVDVGGSHVACARVRGGIVENRREIRFAAPTSLAAVMPGLEAHLAILRGREPVAGVSIAFPGLVDPRSGRVASTPAGKFEDAVGFDFTGWARERLGLALRLEVDGRMALLGEHRFGALRGVDDAVLLSLGTGIGSAALMRGAMVRGRSGQASVLGGHLTVEIDGPTCLCGNLGCAEALASSWALPRLIAALPGRGALHDLAAPDLKAVFDLARDGDAGARAVRAACLAAWAAAALNLVHAYDATRVLVTGGVAAAEEVVPFIQAHVRRHAWCLGEPPLVLRGALGADAALLAATPLWESDRDQL
ncbi:ROK family protein [Sphingomonas yunnanensis]|uniref:ROK family protein n=1 Tax=Sphingomonas yunnanensis TaxID=310400 RepID=UPI001CA73A8C|nr:ROK family protein [Sphingomonas yunnanensis]MBY9063451.1 ROK family protein [Sphingomonas yunnanensis]